MNRKEKEALLRAAMIGTYKGDLVRIESIEDHMLVQDQRFGTYTMPILPVANIRHVGTDIEGSVQFSELEPVNSPLTNLAEQGE